MKMVLLKFLYLTIILLLLPLAIFPVTDLVTLPDPSLPLTSPLFDFTQWIFPNVNFTCSANIISWRLRVNDSIDSGNTQQRQRPLPRITTWRLLNSFETYILQSTTNESQGEVTIMEGGVYEYTPSKPISVQAGDIVGITMPPSDDERTKSVVIKPLFLRLPEGNSSTVSCVRLENSQYFFLDDGMCLFQQQQLSLYVPLLTAIIIGRSNSTISPSSTLEPTSTAINMITNVAPTVTMVHTIVSTASPSPTHMSPTTTKRLDKGLIIGILIAGVILFVLAMMSVVIFLAMICLKQQQQAMPLTNDQLQQRMMEESKSVTPHQLPSEDYEISSLELMLKSNDACIPNTQQQVSIETEENVAYNFNTGTENEDYYSNDQYDYEQISDY